MLVLDDFHRVSSAAARDSVAWFVDHLPATVQLVLVDPRGPRPPARRAARARPAARAAGRRAALHRRRGRRVPQRPARPRAGDGRRRAARRADRGLARRPLPRRALARRPAPTSPRWCGRSTGRARTSSTSSPTRCWPATRPTLQDFMVRTSVLERLCAPLCDAVLGQAAAAARARRRSRARTCSCCRSTTSGAGTASTTSSPSCCASSWRGASRRRCRSCIGARRVAPRLGHGGRGDPPRPRGGRVRRGRGADRRDLGPLRQRAAAPRRCSTGWTSSRAGGAGRRRAPAAGPGVDLGAARARGRMRAALARVARSASLEAGPLPDGFASLASSVSHAARGVRLGRRRRGARARARARPARRPGLAVAAGRHVGARLGALLPRRARRGRALVARRRSALAPARPVGRRRRRRSPTCR